MSNSLKMVTDTTLCVVVSTNNVASRLRTKESTIISVLLTRKIYCFEVMVLKRWQHKSGQKYSNLQFRFSDAEDSGLYRDSRILVVLLLRMFERKLVHRILEYLKKAPK